MTGKADFTAEEWELIREAPTTAGMIVVTAQGGGTIRESFAMAKAWTEARQQHGESQVLDELVAEKPKVDRTRARSVDELKQHGLQQLRDATALLQSKATPEELEGYRRFVLALADKVASAHREGEVSVSPSEHAAIDEISAALSS
jgi:hypothetical protein